MQFDDVLAKYRKEARSESEKGDRFERLMVRFLKTYPVYESRFVNVWQWRDFPYRASVSPGDTGIDIVAEDAVDGGFWAVQAKCYREGAAISKADLDGFISTSGRSFRLPSGEMVPFVRRLLISTTDSWSSTANATIRNQNPRFSRLNLSLLRGAPVDWELLDKGVYGARARAARKIPRDYQAEAVGRAREHYRDRDRGKLILACGTGKTYVSLRIAESETGGRGVVLFLAPSIALIGQTLREWSADASGPVYGICVCSDPQVNKGYARAEEDEDGFGTVDLPYPADTSPAKVAEQLRTALDLHGDRLSVVFSTYQSAGVVSEAARLMGDGFSFDMMVCDEAHRTTGVEETEGKGEERRLFARIHEQGFIPARKRLYMTATPRIYVGDALAQAAERGLRLYSMDDESLYGGEFFRMSFSRAVERGYLSDYKVIVLTLGREAESPELSAVLREVIAEEKAKGRKEIDIDDATRILGCVYAFSKRMDTESESIKATDPAPMRKAVAFCESIRKSRQISSLLETFATDRALRDWYFGDVAEEDRDRLTAVSARHIDGTMGATERGGLMRWLEESPPGGNQCRILTNVYCLSEGVDVPSLDAVVFLSQRKSDIQIVQSVGRVMRQAPGKRFGYIIIPIVIPHGISPEAALSDHRVYGVLWSVLKALKAHDDRFDSEVNRIRFNVRKESLLTVATKPVRDEDDPKGARETPERKRELSQLAEGIASQAAGGGFRQALYAKIVRMTGSERDLELWAADVAGIAKGYIDGITGLIGAGGEARSRFDAFLQELRESLNPSVDEAEAVRMLAQHAASMPVFEKLYQDYSFAAHNAVSRSMQGIIDVLGPSLAGCADSAINKAYLAEDGSVDLAKVARASRFVQGIDNAEARQRIVVDLYDKFFRKAFPDVTERLGIVYTPWQVVDFINNSADQVLRREFGRSLSDENVHVLDPFTGTGTFVSRLIRSGLLGDSLERKYRTELHANEIVLLAYYIASINIESAYDEMMGPGVQYVPFGGICLTDTFQLFEKPGGGLRLDRFLKMNSDRVESQRKTPIMVIVGNPPYSAGQRSANDNAQNIDYPMLDKRINDTYVHESKASLKNKLYDSYVRAFRWGTERLLEYPETPGVIAYVTNAGWLDGNAMDGMRKCLAREFSSIYVFNLRGNQRTSGELSRKEGGKIFGSGSRAAIAITLLVRNPAKLGEAEIRYCDIGDYLDREEKLKILEERKHVFGSGMDMISISPNKDGDWLNNRNPVFGEFNSIGDKYDPRNERTFFYPVYSLGMSTNRDIWCYNSSGKSLCSNARSTIGYYNKQRERYHADYTRGSKADIRHNIESDSTRISWSDGLLSKALANQTINFSPQNVRVSSYRPFFKQYFYFDKQLNERSGRLPTLFPTPDRPNLVICVSAFKDGLPLISDCIPDLHFNGDTQCFPRYWYEEATGQSGPLFSKDGGREVDVFVRRDAVTDWIMEECIKNFGNWLHPVSKDHIFHYVYAMLHSSVYRETFSADLKKSLPRIPLVPLAEDFLRFSEAGHDLARLHLGYETVKPYPARISGAGVENFLVHKMRYGKGMDGKADRSVMQFNDMIRVEGIPLEAYDYVLNGKPAIDWIMERYQITVHKDSGIRNDPNDWARERGEPRYILDLLLRVITVSLETMRIVRSLPRPDFSGTK
ncbi:MAG: DEAD/DEAH box helicase family protein [Deltaproteobacteria bacterium]|jgi:predicted helicase|nr:DEAD/DEAH box helicase family protein [Deltaproteobacteria bacterium]